MGTLDPPPAPARLLQANRVGEQETRGRAGNEDQAPDQDLAAAAVRHKQALVCERAKEEREGAGNGSGNTKGPQRDCCKLHDSHYQTSLSVGSGSIAPKNQLGMCMVMKNIIYVSRREDGLLAINTGW